MASRKNVLPATHEKGLEVYFRDINRYDLITREDEVMLAQRIKQGDEEALQTLVRANLRFVVSVAKRYINQGLLLSDLINEGNLGLLKAAHRFDEQRGFRFISYAVWWIRQSIMQALLDKSRIVRLPQNEGVPSPDADQIAERLEIEPEDVRHALRSDRVELGLDDCGTDGGDRPLGDIIEDQNQPAPDFAVLQRGLQEDVRKALACLSEREARVIIQYFGLSFEEAQTLQVIGQRLGLTRERIRQIKEKALERMRGSTSRALLKDYY